MPMPKQLNSIGMGVFISEYEYFASNPPHSDAIAYLMNKGISNRDGAIWRINNVKYLFDNQSLLCESLEYIAYTSRRATVHQKEKAVGFLKGL